MKVVIYGGGVAALSAAHTLKQNDVDVVLVGPLPAARMPGLAEGGISCGGDALFDDTMRCAGGVASEDGVRAMVEAAPALIAELVELGVPLSDETRRLAGASEENARFAGCITGPTIARALDRAVGDVERHDRQELCRVVEQDGRAVGIVAWGAQPQAFAADAVLIAPHNSTLPFGDSAIVRAGADLRFDGFRTLATRLSRRGRRHFVSGALVAEGARFWSTADKRPARAIPRKERDHFAEDFAADDVAAREASEREGRVYLDITHLPEAHLRSRLGRELDACAPLVATDPYRHPLRVRHAVAGMLGGIAVDDSHASSVPGLFAAGAATNLYHGRCPVGGNVLLADLFGGRRAAEAILDTIEPADTPGSDAEIDLDDEPEPEPAAPLLAVAEALAFGGDVDGVDHPLVALAIEALS